MSIEDAKHRRNGIICSHARLPSHSSQHLQTHFLSDQFQDSVELPQHPLVDQQPHCRVQDVTVSCHTKHGKCKWSN